MTILLALLDESKDMKNSLPLCQVLFSKPDLGNDLMACLQSGRHLPAMR